MIHLGKFIYQELKRQERTPTWLARKINCERPNVYYIFKRSSLNTELLQAISLALNVNLFKILSDETQAMINQNNGS